MGLCFRRNNIGVVMVNRLTWGVVDHGFIQPWSCQTKDYKTVMCCFYIQQVALRSKSKDLLSGRSLPPSSHQYQNFEDLCTHNMPSVLTNLT